MTRSEGRAEGMTRVEGRDKVTGRARYAFEYAPDGVAYAHVVAATVARGRVTAIDGDGARALPGVLEILSADNAPEIGTTSRSWRCSSPATSPTAGRSSPR